jgi:hypothetical protein
MQELLVLAVIALAIFYLPRVMVRRPAPEPALRRPSLTGRRRLAILFTLFWIAASAMVLKPWEKDPLTFVYLGLGPTAALWGAFWVWLGYRKHRR